MNAKTSATPDRGSAASRSRAASPALVRLSLKLLGAGPVVILFALIILLGFLSPYFLTGRNLGNILAQTAVIALVAMGQHIVILTRGIDLSVGSNLALASVVGALVYKGTDSTVLTVAAMIMSGGLVGAVNGLVYVYGRLPHPFIITLATLSIAKGTALELANGRAIQGMPDLVRAVGGGSAYGIPGSLFVVAGVAALFAVMAKTMVWGRWLYAVGGRPEAAMQMGIPVRPVLISAYVISGLCAGLGALLLAGRTDAGSPLFGNLLELDTIAAVIIGGASFLGGRGHIGHALVGAIMIGVIRNALNLLNVDIFFQLIVIGVVIVIAVEADVLRNHLEGRMRMLQAAGQS
ncbi:ABC transporter permease [Hoeflea marina]|nr:ABC transporter permease [Hoeflea marina]